MDSTFHHIVWTCEKKPNIVHILFNVLLTRYDINLVWQFMFLTMDFATIPFAQIIWMMQ